MKNGNTLIFLEVKDKYTRTRIYMHYVSMYAHVYACTMYPCTYLYLYEKTYE